MGDGGVIACWRGEDLYGTKLERWVKEEEEEVVVVVVNGDRDVRLFEVGDWGTCADERGYLGGAKVVWCMEEALTAVISRSESAEVAASMSSSHRLDAGPCGSAKKAFLPSVLILLAFSLDLVRSCFAIRLFRVTEDFRGLAG